MAVRGRRSGGPARADARTRTRPRRSPRRRASMGISVREFEEEDGELNEINMVPLIDVMLVMLIIFMITMPVLTQRVAVDLPRASAERNLEEPDRVTLAIDAQAQVFWNDEPIDAAELQQRLEEAARQDPHPELHIRGDRKAEYESVLQVMAAAQRAGVEKLGFITQPGDEAPAGRAGEDEPGAPGTTNQGATGSTGTEAPAGAAPAAAAD